jgi:transcriptional regulator with XRE-family HTH domain
MLRKKSPNPTDKHVGARIRMRRMMVGMSQEKLGDALDLTFQQVQKYEKGANRVGASRLQQIARILTVPVSFFFEGGPQEPGHDPEFFCNESPAQPEIVTRFLATREGLDLVEGFTRLKSDKLRRRVVELVAEMAA